MSVTSDFIWSSTPRPRRAVGGFARQALAERGQRRVATVEQQHPGILGLDFPVFRAQRLGGELADLACQLHARRPCADQREREPSALLVGVRGRLGHLERAEDPSPDREGVRDRLHAGRERRVVVMTEIRLPDPGRDDELVIAELNLLAHRPTADEHAAVGIDIDDLGC